MYFVKSVACNWNGGWLNFLLIIAQNSPAIELGCSTCYNWSRIRRTVVHSSKKSSKSLCCFPHILLSCQKFCTKIRKNIWRTRLKITAWNKFNDKKLQNLLTKRSCQHENDIQVDFGLQTSLLNFISVWRSQKCSFLLIPARHIRAPVHSQVDRINSRHNSNCVIEQFAHPLELETGIDDEFNGQTVLNYVKEDKKQGINCSEREYFEF